MKNKVIISLSLLVMLLSGYMFYDSTDGAMSQAQVKTELMNLKSDYEAMQVDLESHVRDLTVTNKEILSQKKEIEAILKKSSVTQEELGIAKKLMSEISQNVLKEYYKRTAHLETGERVSDLKLEDAPIKQKQNPLTTQIKKLQQDKNQLKKQYQKEKKSSLKKDDLISYASKLSVSNFILKGIRVKSNGKEMTTNKASKIHRIELSFDINDNLLVEQGLKELFLVVYQPDKNLAKFKNKESGTFLLNGQAHAYSEKIYVNYINGAPFTVKSQWVKDQFQKGSYVLEVYEETPSGVQIIGKATKTLE